MEIELWNKKQLELFSMFFENKKDNSIPISELSYKIKKLSENWQDLYQIFKMNSNDFDDYSSIRKIKEVIYNNKNYLIFQINIWSYFIIDLNTKKIVDFGENLSPFNEQFFIDNFDERTIINPDKFYYTINYDENNLNNLVDYIDSNKAVFLERNHFNYTLKSSDNYTASISFDVTNGNITVFLGNYNGTVNYIFLNGNLEPIGVSNPTGNMEELKKMVLEVKKITVPVSVIPNYILSGPNKVKKHKKEQ